MMCYILRTLYDVYFINDMLVYSIYDVLQYAMSYCILYMMSSISTTRLWQPKTSRGLSWCARCSNSTSSSPSEPRSDQASMAKPSSEVVSRPSHLDFSLVLA